MITGCEIEMIRDDLSNRFPSRIISVSKTAFSGFRAFQSGPANADYIEYMISVQPGFDGHLNQNFGGNDFQECLDKLNAVAPK